MRDLKRQFDSLRTALLRPEGRLPLPLHLQIEPTNACNLSCEFCPRVKEKPHHLMPDEFKKILLESQAQRIAFSGLGEPTCNPHLFEMIQWSKSQGCHINITSNMVLTDRIITEVVESGLDQLKISIDSATRETYHTVRGYDAFETVVTNIQNLDHLKKERGRATPRVRFQFVIQNKNFREMASLVGLAKRLGVEAVYFQPLELDYVKEKEEARNLVKGLQPEELLTELKRANSKAKEEGVATNLDLLIRRFSTYWQKYLYPPKESLTTYPCFRPWITAFITSTGEMWPCCQFGGVKLSVGNVLNESFEEVWNGAKMTAFRRAMNKERRPLSICKNCVPERLHDMTILRKIW